MTYTSDRPIAVDGVRLDTLAWNIEKINRQVASRRSADVQVPGRDGVIASLNDSLEPAMMGLEMFVRGTDPDGAVPAEGRRDRMWANLDELIHLFGKRHALLDVQEGPRPRRNLAYNAWGRQLDDPMIPASPTWVPLWAANAWDKTEPTPGAVRFDSTGTPNTLLWGLNHRPAVTPGQRYALRAKVRSNIASNMFRVVLQFGSDSQTADVTQGFKALTHQDGSGTTWLTAVGVAPSWATNVIPLLNLEAVPEAGRFVEFSAITMTGGAVEVYRNPVKNPRFSDDWRLSGWTVFGPGIDVETFTQVSGPPGEGTAIRVPSTGVVYQDVDVIAGRSYVISCKMRVETLAAPNQFTVHDTAEANPAGAQPTTVGEWQRLSFPWTATATGKVRVHAWGHNGWTEVTQFQVDETTATQPRRFFDGDSEMANGLIYAWEGTPRESGSWAYGLPLQGWGTMGGTTLTQGADGQSIALRNRKGFGYYLASQEAAPPVVAEAGRYYAVSIRVRRIPGEPGQGSMVLTLWDGSAYVAENAGQGSIDTANLPMDGSAVWLHSESVRPSASGEVSSYVYSGDDAAALVDMVMIEEVSGPGETLEGLAYFDGYTVQADKIARWEGTPDLSASSLTDTRTRRAWAKVTDTIAPDLNESGSAGRFKVGLEIPSGTWEDPHVQNWWSPGWNNGATREVTTLQGATERTSDLVVAVVGPINNPRLTDPTTGHYVQLNRNLTEGEQWRLNASTWSSRWGHSSVVYLQAADSAGTDAQPITTFGGGSNLASFLSLTPRRDAAGVRRTYLTLTGTGGTSAATAVNLDARRKFAL